MQLKRIVSRVFLILFILLSSIACLMQTDNTHVAYGDALIKSFREGDSIRYNIQFYTYSWYSMIDVIVSSEKGNTSTVLDTFESKYSFAFRPEKTSYSSTVPEAAKYTFDILFEDGTTYSSVDYLDSLVIDPPIVSELSFDDEKDSFYLKWDKVKNAQYYNVLLKNANNDIAFESDLIQQSETQIWINEYSNGWRINQKPTTNTSYQVVINAYLFEPVATTFDIQCISVNDQFKIEWLLE